MVAAAATEGVGVLAVVGVGLGVGARVAVGVGWLAEVELEPQATKNTKLATSRPRVSMRAKDILRFPFLIVGLQSKATAPGAVTPQP
jgi:hypothetical protein